MGRSTKVLELPYRERPRWHTTDRRSELLYLGWGLRNFNRNPTYPLGSYPEDAWGRDTWSYNLILRGSPTLVWHDGLHRLSPNDAFVLSCHGTYPCGSKGDPTGYTELLAWTWRTPPLIAAVKPALGGYHLCRMDAQARKRLVANHKLCRHETTHADEFTPVVLKALRAQCDAEFARCLHAQQAKTDRQHLADDAVRWMQQNLRQPNPIFLLCDYLQVSQSTLDRLFLNLFGDSPSAYHHRLRIEEARRLRAEGKLSVKQIAFHLGYRHANALSRAFKAFQSTKPGKH